MRSKTVSRDQGAGPTNGPREVRRSASRPGLTRRHQPGEGRRRLAPRWLVLHLGLYLVVNGFFTVTWLLAPDVPGVDEQFWPAWIMLLLAIFDRPGHAIRCAVALRHRLHRLGVEIRAGLHTGEVQVRGADVGGIAVHVAARVMAPPAPERCWCHGPCTTWSPALTWCWRIGAPTPCGDGRPVAAVRGAGLSRRPARGSAGDGDDPQDLLCESALPMDPSAGGGVLGSDVAGAEPPEGVAVQLDRRGGTLGVAAA